MNRFLRSSEFHWLRRICRALLFLAAGLVGSETQTVTLTEQHRVAEMAIDAKSLAAGLPVLEVDVTEFSNPGLVPVGVAVFLATGEQKIAVGNFAFFPADHKGNFLLNSQAAFAKVGRVGKARLVFELRKLRDSAVWKPVRVTIGAPKWRRD